MAKRYEELKFTDNFMFCKVMEQYPDICRRVTEVITGRKIRQIVTPESQKSVEITEGNRGVRFDVYFEDDEDNMYDVEMQTYHEDEPLRRARYYQSMIDLASMERGARFTELKDSYIIFIGLQDFFDAGLSCYCFERICPDLPGVNDGAHTIFVNASGVLDGHGDEYVRFLDYLKSWKPSDGLTGEIAAAVEVLRDRSDLRREYMTFQEIIDKEKQISREEALREGEERGRAELLSQLVEEGLLSEEEAEKHL